MSPTPSPPFLVVALYPYQSDHPDDLPFEAGQKIQVQVVEDDEWFNGNILGNPDKKGMFPRNFVEISPEVPTPASRPKPRTSVPPPPPTAEEDDWSEDEQEEEEKSIHIGPPSEEQPPVVVATTANPAPAPPLASPIAPTSAPVESVTNKLSKVNISRSAEPESSPSSAPVSHSQQSPTAEDHQATPSSRNAFKDRIAAFNVQSDAAPIVPTQQKFASFAKKPYVPPPSSYVPTMPKSQPPLIRTSTFESVAPSITSPITANAPVFESSSGYAHNEDVEEEADVPKMTLSERIKLLQQHGQEEQERQEAAILRKKQKAKAKKAAAESAPVPVPAEQSESATEQTPESRPIPLQRTSSSGSRTELVRTATGGSIASIRSGIAPDEQPNSPIQPRRSGSFSDRRRSVDQSRKNLDDRLVTEDEENKDVSEESKASPEVNSQEDNREEEAEENEEENEQDVDDDEDDDDDNDEEDEEEAKRIALRERMARISGGMGMNIGMLMTGGFPQPPAKTKPKKAPVPNQETEEEQVQVNQAPVPIFPFADPNALAALRKPSIHSESKEEEDDAQDDEGVEEEQQEEEEDDDEEVLGEGNAEEEPRKSIEGSLNGGRQPPARPVAPPVPAPPIPPQIPTGAPVPPVPISPTSPVVAPPPIPSAPAPPKVPQRQGSGGK